MTAISATSSTSAYSAYSRTSITSLSSAATKSETSTAASSAETYGATNITLSDSARAALSSKTFTEVIAEARASLTELLEQADSDSPYEDGELIIDMSGFDRRELYAIASNTDGTFTEDEIKAASATLDAGFDQAMAGPYAVYNVTGSITKLYESALSYLEDASPEEQASAEWETAHDAVKQALGELEASPTTWPDIDDDPVFDYLERLASGDTADLTSFSTVASNARAAIDQQAADAEAQGKELVFSQYRRSGVQIDFSEFNSRALSAISLNEGDQFSDEEIRAANTELATRSSQVLLSCFSNADLGTNPTALAENVLSAYGSLSSEEREAVGWGEDFYNAAIANYKSASTIASMFSSTSTSSTSLF